MHLLYSFFDSVMLSAILAIYDPASFTFILLYHHQFKDYINLFCFQDIKELKLFSFYYFLITTNSNIISVMCKMYISNVIIICSLVRRI